VMAFLVPEVMQRSGFHSRDSVQGTHLEHSAYFKSET
jgi:hypothetical protein